MSFLHKKRAYAESTQYTIVSSIWNCIYCDCRLAVPDKWIKDVKSDKNGKHLQTSLR